MKFSKLIMGCLAALSLAVAGMAHAQEDAEREAIAERLKPVGELCLEGEDCGTASAPTTASAGNGGAVDGASVYNNVCMACHETGAAGAPVRGEEGAWASRIDQGVETLYDHAINGFNAMPAKGGNPNLSDDEVKAAVNHLVEPVYEGELPQVGGGASEETAANGEEEGEAAAAAASDIDGKAIYGQVCMACHDTGAAGAPKLGDSEAWAPRIEKGKEELYSSAINGIGAMPPKGGNTSLSDEEVQAVVDYMVEQTQ
ncbi:cytochrome [Litchfieldella qijiaojingensis]|uniref:Cytochrome n=1 Tax=Litchfieldella qijiaojingensis TaxID=980347 RepID=A0ABQ2Z4I5_9GAMM|nr:c-type cytochrome [Halomonas qijiaojingensis]GGY04205.1 cytochrome [Halomonas qijiaojingensis]